MSMIGILAQEAIDKAAQVSRILNQGTRGEDVKALQSKLNSFGAGKLTPDGAFGQKTFDAVVQFQKMLQLKPDGIVGQKTAEALGLKYTGPTFGGAGSMAAAAVGAVGGVASVVSGAGGAAVGAVGPSPQDMLMKFSLALGQGLANAAGGPTGAALAALQKKAAEQIITKIIPAIQGGQYGETAAGIANTAQGMSDEATNKIRQLKAEVTSAAGDLPVVGGLFSELGRSGLW